MAKSTGGMRAARRSGQKAAFRVKNASIKKNARLTRVDIASRRCRSFVASKPRGTQWHSFALRSRKMAMCAVRGSYARSTAQLSGAASSAKQRSAIPGLSGLSVTHMRERHVAARAPSESLGKS